MQAKFRGTFSLSVDKESDPLINIGASGNARQRRLLVRRLKARGYTVSQFIPFPYKGKREYR